MLLGGMFKQKKEMGNEKGGKSLSQKIISSPDEVLRDPIWQFNTTEARNSAELEFGLTGDLFDNHTAPRTNPHPQGGLDLILG